MMIEEEEKRMTREEGAMLIMVRMAEESEDVEGTKCNGVWREQQSSKDDSTCLRSKRQEGMEFA